MKIWVSTPLLALALLAVFPSCSSSPAISASVPPNAPSSSVAKPPPAPVALPPGPSYAYNPVGKRDPFRSPVEDVSASAGAENSACNEPLCQWNLDQLTLVAVVTGDSSPMGMVEDPQGHGFIVRQNTKMGKQGGRVTNILRDAVIVTEFWQRPDSKERVANPVTMKLHTDAKDEPSMDLASGKLVE